MNLFLICVTSLYLRSFFDIFLFSAFIVYVSNVCYKVCYNVGIIFTFDIIVNLLELFLNFLCFVAFIC